MKLALLHALVNAADRMTRAIAALASDDFETARVELEAVEQIVTEQAQELRAA